MAGMPFVISSAAQSRAEVQDERCGMLAMALESTAKSMM